MCQVLETHSEGLTGSLLPRRLYVLGYGERWVDPQSVWRSTQKNMERDWMCGEVGRKEMTPRFGMIHPNERDGWWGSENAAGRRVKSFLRYVGFEMPFKNPEDSHSSLMGEFWEEAVLEI